ncbi:peptidylprolyl isomerase [Aeromicrobium sp. CF4.19]|uniref:peptidylprolyl isomerase n=1 Tax=Aeromicrobium sp. CF4.19 TaxID=3373082 RepID=UPI003EE4C4C0
MRRPSFVLLAPVVACLGLLTACGSDDPEPAEDACSWMPGSGPVAKDVDAPAEDAEPAETAVITFAQGDVTVTLDPEARCAATSFTSLAEQGYFDDGPCSRVSDPSAVPYGIVQCGDPTGTGGSGPGYTFADELEGDEAYPRGTVAMANAGPDTNGSQFFLNFDDSDFPSDYTVFGTIDEAGLEVLDEVAAVGAQGGAPDGPPAEPIVIESVSVP